MAIPDFGWDEQDFHGTKLTCRFVAPGLTFSDLYRVYTEAEKDLQAGDALRGNPSKWPGARGVKAVTEAVLAAVYGPSKEPDAPTT